LLISSYLFFNLLVTGLDILLCFIATGLLILLIETAKINVFLISKIFDIEYQTELLIIVYVNSVKLFLNLVFEKQLHDNIYFAEQSCVAVVIKHFANQHLINFICNLISFVKKLLN